MTTRIRRPEPARPPIIVTETELRRLTRLAEAALPHAPDVAEELLNEMDRAEIINDSALPAGVVGINSTVTYRTDANETRRVRLVMPLEADIAKDKISILTPIGVALIGLSQGQTMGWKSRDGRKHSLKVLRVENGQAPAAADEDDPGPAAA